MYLIHNKEAQTLAKAISVISWTRPWYPDSPQRSWSISWKRRNTQKKLTQDPTWRQGGAGCGQSNVEIPPEWNAVPDLIMEDEEGIMIMETDTKRKRDKVAWGRRKRRKEDDIRPEKHEHLPKVSWRTWNPAGFYLTDWNELQQEEDVPAMCYSGCKGIRLIQDIFDYYSIIIRLLFDY